jgi:hypothetical protein
MHSAPEKPRKLFSENQITRCHAGDMNETRACSADSSRSFRKPRTKADVGARLEYLGCFHLYGLSDTYSTPPCSAGSRLQAPETELGHRTARRGKEGNAACESRKCSSSVHARTCDRSSLPRWDGTLQFLVVVVGFPESAHTSKCHDDLADLLAFFVQQDVRPSRHDHARRC